MQLRTKENGEMYCRLKCGRYLGRVVEDGQAFEIGFVLLWNKTRINCVCGRFHFYFEPRSLADDTDLDYIEIDDEVWQ